MLCALRPRWVLWTLRAPVSCNYQTLCKPDLGFALCALSLWRRSLRMLSWLVGTFVTVSMIAYASQRSVCP